MKAFSWILGTLVFAIALPLAGCSSGSSGGGTTQMTTLAGTVRGPTGAGLPGVGVTIDDSMGNTVSTVTDANGDFIALDPPRGAVEVHFDGTTATVPGTFAELGIAMDIVTGENNLPQAIVLPDLDDGVTESVSVDASGMTTSDTDVMVDTDSILTIPTGVTILLDGAPAVGSVDVNMTPVPPENVPMPLPTGLDPSAFVTIQPGNATFDNGMNMGMPQGVPITLPNTRNFAVGTMVDIYSFDHAEGAWVNRSAETGNQGMVMDLGGGMTAIVADNVITEGGWHSGTVPVNAACATTIRGRVVDLSGNPVPNVLVSLSTGQFGRTDSSGVFTIQLVTAYDAGMLPTCVAIQVIADFLAPVSFGSGTAQVTVMAGSIVHAGITDIGDVPLNVTATGSLVGLVSDNGQGVAGTVSITGPQNIDVMSDSQGTFFIASLDPGDYMASFDFPTGTSTVNFTITTHETTVINLVPQGTGGSQVNVLVFGMPEINADAVPIAGARVTLEAANTTAFGITNSNGIATFNNATGPFTVTAQAEMDLGGGVLQRLAMSVVGVNPPGNPATIGVPLLEAVAPTPTLDATVDGVVSNVPAGTFVMVEVASNEVPGGFSALVMPDFQTGAYSLQVPSGVPLDASAVALGPSSIGAVIETGLMAGTGQTITQDFDFNGPNFCAFDNTVTITSTNAPTGPDVFGFGFLQVRGAGDLFFPAVLAPTMGDAPPSILLPDFTNAKFSGLFKTVEIGVEIDDAVNFDSNSVNCEMILGSTTPTMLQVDFVGQPTVTTPADMATLTCSQSNCLDLEGEPFAFTLGMGVAGLPNGINIIDIDGDGPGNITTQWDIWLASNVTNTTLPAISPDMLMFFDGEYDLDVEVLRFNAPGFNFATFFDGNVAQRIRDLRATSDFCESEGDSSFSVDAPPAVGVSSGSRGDGKMSRYRELMAAFNAARQRAERLR